jgi:hypothetical protein
MLYRDTMSSRYVGLRVMLGYELMLRLDTLLRGISVQNLGQCGFFLPKTLGVFEFCDRFIPTRP